MTETKSEKARPLPNTTKGTTPGGHLAYERLHANLGALKLSVAESIVDSYLESTASEGKSVIEVLDYLLDQEVRARSTAAVEMRLKLSGFPVRKTMEEFDLGVQPSIDPRVIQELRTLRFVHNAENVIFLGPPGQESWDAPLRTFCFSFSRTSCSTSFSGTLQRAWG